MALRLRVRDAGNPGSEIGAGLCPHVALENTRYANVRKGGSWAPVNLGDQLGVCSVDTLQLRTDGCAGIQLGLDVVLTTTHPNLGAVSPSKNGPGGPDGFGLPAAVPGERFGTAVNGLAPPAGGWTLTGLADCAYVITLSAELLLTTGDSSPLPLQDQRFLQEVVAQGPPTLLAGPRGGRRPPPRPESPQRTRGDHAASRAPTRPRAAYLGPS